METLSELSSRTGEKVIFAGVYKATHAENHAAAHYVTIMRGEGLPSCKVCGNQVRFELAVSATAVRFHELFHNAEDNRNEDGP